MKIERGEGKNEIIRIGIRLLGADLSAVTGCLPVLWCFGGLDWAEGGGG